MSFHATVIGSSASDRWWETPAAGATTAGDAAAGDAAAASNAGAGNAAAGTETKVTVASWGLVATPAAFSSDVMDGAAESPGAAPCSDASDAAGVSFVGVEVEPAANAAAAAAAVPPATPVPDLRELPMLRSKRTVAKTRNWHKSVSSSEPMRKPIPPHCQSRVVGMSYWVSHVSPRVGTPGTGGVRQEMLADAPH